MTRYKGDVQRGKKTLGLTDAGVSLAHPVGRSVEKVIKMILPVLVN